jgi:hypothetical protein
VKSLFFPLLYFYFFCFNHISSSPIVEKVDKSEFPKIKIQIREELNKPIQNQTVSIKETLNSSTKEIVVVDVLKKVSQRPVKVFFVVQASSIENNSYSREIVSSILKKIEDTDKLSLYIYSNEELFFSENLDPITINNKISSIPEGKINKLYYNLNSLFLKIREESMPTFMILISHQTPSDFLNPNSLIFESALNMHIRIHSIMRDDTTGNILANRTGGNYYSLSDKMILNNLYNNLAYIKKTPTILEYYSGFEEASREIDSQKINIELKIDNLVFELNYNIGILNYIGYKFQDVEFVFSILISVLMLCFIFLYSIIKSKEKTKEAIFKNRRDNKYKADLYYHENNAFHEGNKVAVLTTSSFSSDEEDDFLIKEPQQFRSSIESEIHSQTPRDLPKGKQYSSAFLIQKEGPNPGRQFNITKDEIEVGSAISNDLILKDSTISNKHARIKKIKGAFYIYDIVSQRGTFVNGKKVLKPKPLSDFDEIRLGRTLLLFRGK